MNVAFIISQSFPSVFLSANNAWVSTLSSVKHTDTLLTEPIALPGFTANKSINFSFVTACVHYCMHMIAYYKLNWV